MNPEDLQDCTRSWLSRGITTSARQHVDGNTGDLGGCESSISVESEL